MYLPEHFRQNDLAAIRDLITDHPLAALITQADGEFEANHYPLIYVPPSDASPQGRLVGHLSKANSQWKSYQPGTPALAIFRGPEHYISPTWYLSKQEHGRVVPTWNYAAVHIHGTLTIHHDAAWLLDLVTQLTDHHEAKQSRSSSGQPWQVTDAPPEFVEGQLKAIVGLELQITKIETKWKMSQNRSLDDQRSTIAALEASATPSAKSVAAIIRRRLPDLS